MKPSDLFSVGDEVVVIDSAGGRLTVGRAGTVAVLGGAVLVGVNFPRVGGGLDYVPVNIAHVALVDDGLPS